MKREYPEHPLVGVAAVVFDDASVWLARRNQEPSRGLWSLPGGLVELGEAHLEALARELREELSISMAVGGLAGVFDKIFRDPEGRIRYHYVVVDYWGWITRGRPTPASDVSEVRKIPLDQLDGFGLDPELLLTVRTAETAWRNRIRGAG
ncbi:MAG: NUDIX hydrolase [Deltaproteobacteria bacterium]|nr:NUDIX hydrolase [Deltaproteobacteria bacterium]